MLEQQWPIYRKPMNAHALGRQFTLADLLRVAKVDVELATLLRRIGLMKG
jgi:hypothetical protein